MEIKKQLDVVRLEDHFALFLFAQMVGSVESFMGQIQTQGVRDRVFKRYYKVLAERMKCSMLT